MKGIRPLLFICGFSLQCLSLAAHGADDGAAAADPAEPAAAGSVDLSLSSRHGLDRDRRLALAEYRAQLEAAGNPAPDWHTQAKLGWVTERKLDRQADTRLEVDALYARYEGERCGSRIGVQQVVWGGADRLQVLDVIHPLDLRESYFGDWQRKRLPLAMLNVECGLGEQSIQLLLVPQTRFDRRPSTQGRFALPGVAAQLAARGIRIVDGGKPGAGEPADWSGGAQWSGKAGEADVTLNAYRGWQGEQRYRPDGAVYRKEAARFHMVGASYTRPIGPLVVRLEGARNRGITGYARGAGGRLEPLDTRQTSYLLGVDYSTEPWFFSAQLFDRKQEADRPLALPDRQRTATLAARRSLLQDRLHLTGYVAWDRIESASYASLTARYEFGPQLLGTAAIERFHGSARSFGLLEDQSRLLVGLEYHFK
ncbi:hypothetical protein [Chitinimonas koreensis]|uniref:hypothetical protein n=1 Tax=Chitinimonas koreensis TaxID=356302 RepID=UPI0003F4C4CB|nr:hypothetical protein [Chitinimonas koreensis]QNM98206.1 hypothetical protein H9L41_08175 [Chitinimonas koreensis]